MGSNCGFYTGVEQISKSPRVWSRGKPISIFFLCVNTRDAVRGATQDPCRYELTLRGYLAYLAAERRGVDELGCAALAMVEQKK